MNELPILELRRIEANIIKPIYEELVEALGKTQAQAIIGRAVRRDARAQASALAEETKPQRLADFVGLLERWTASGALEMDVLESGEERFSFNVTRCRYAEMYRELGLEEIGNLLSCNRDAAFCEGYDERLALRRSQTIMGGASHCDFRYRYGSGSGG